MSDEPREEPLKIQEHSIRENKEFYRKDELNWGMVFEYEWKAVSEARIQGDLSGFFRAITSLDASLCGFRDQIYDEEMRMLTLNYAHLQKQETYTPQELDWWYYDERHGILKALMFRANRGKAKTREYMQGGKFIGGLALNLKAGIGQNVFVTGKPGSGKSYTCLALATGVSVLTGCPFSIKNNVVFNLSEFMDAYNDEKRLPPGSVLIAEEMGVNLNSREAMSRETIDFNKVAQTMRHRAILVLFNAPDLGLLDKTPRKMLHYWLETIKVDRRLQMNFLKPHYVEVNQQNGDILFPYPVYDGVQLTELRVEKVADSVTNEYEKRADAYKRKLALEIGESLNKGKKNLQYADLTPHEQEHYTLYKKWMADGKSYGQFKRDFKTPVNEWIRIANVIKQERELVKQKKEESLPNE